LRHPIAQRFKTFNRQSFLLARFSYYSKHTVMRGLNVHFGTPLRQSINHEVVQAQMRTLLAQVHQPTNGTVRHLSPVFMKRGTLYPVYFGFADKVGTLWIRSSAVEIDEI
jgi:hypothetical protein